MPTTNEPPQLGTDQNVSAHLLDLSNKIELLIVSHKELADTMTKMKEAIYHPDEGIYSRIRELERATIKDGDVRMAKVEETIGSVKKIQWMVISMTVTAIMAVIFKMFSA